MNILIITDSYSPEIRTISFMVKDLAEELARYGHEVTVVTSWPKYNLNNQDSHKNFNEFSIENNVRVVRVKSPPHHKINFIIRGLVELILPFIFYKKINTYLKKGIDKIIIFSPPLPLAMIGIKVKKRLDSEYYLYFTDIFPQSAIDLGVMKNKIIIKLFEWIENKCYKNADLIISSTNHSREFLIEKKQLPEGKVITIPNWIDDEGLKDIKPTGEFRKRFGLLNKFIFLFAGTISLPQNLEFIIHLAKKLTDDPEICFLLIGEGREKKRLQQMAKHYKLSNVMFSSFISKEEYSYLIKEIDAGLICLGIKNKTPVIPGKLLSFMASAVPVVAFLNKESDAHAIIKEANCGYTGISNDLNNAEKIIRRVLSEKDKLPIYGNNGYEYFIKHFSKKVCVDKFKTTLKA